LHFTPLTRTKPLGEMQILPAIFVLLPQTAVANKATVCFVWMPFAAKVR
jgi:hypothetical protein